MRPIRVLHEDVLLDAGGVETLLMNLYRHMDRDRVQFDFMVHRPQPGVYEEEITALGGRIWRTPPFDPFRLPAYKRAVTAILRAHPEYKVLHAHADLCGWTLRCAAACGVPTRIAHSHAARAALDLKACFMRYESLWLKRHCTDLFMCSTPAGEWLFGKKAVREGRVRFIKNGIETERFRFRAQARDAIRREFQAGDKLVFCHVGNFSRHKNDTFLLDIFAEIHRMDPQTMLLMIGSGELREACIRKAAELHLEDAVRFPGVRGDIPELLMGADCFLFPSLWEGLPFACIEAQAAGLPVLLSDTVTPEVIVTDRVRVCPLTASARQWAEAALALCRPGPRTDCCAEVAAAGFDIRTTAALLQEFYLTRTAAAEREG